jgi:hypothetical protein
MATKPECFVIQPIGESDSPERKHAGQVVKHLIEHVVGDDYEVKRADTLGKPGIITSQIVEHLIDADLVIADLTDRNPNVMYELAIRHVTRRPLVHLMKRGQKLPFDISLMRTVFYDLTDPDSVEEARKELAEHVRGMRADPSDLDTPISVALDIQSLRASGNPVEKSLGEIQAALADLQARLRPLTTWSSPPGNLAFLTRGTAHGTGDVFVPAYTSLGRTADYYVEPKGLEPEPEDYEGDEEHEPDFDDIGD